MRKLISERLTRGCIRDDEEMPPIYDVTQFINTKAKEYRKLKVPNIPF